MKWLKKLWNKIRLEIRYRKKVKAARDQDPYIYE
jgi:hypothetical protein